MSPAVLFSLDWENRERSFDDDQSANPGADNLLLLRMLIYEDELSGIACLGTLVGSR